MPFLRFNSAIFILISILFIYEDVFVYFGSVYCNKSKILYIILYIISGDGVNFLGT